MKIVFGLGHPAHYHLYKHLITILSKSCEIKVVISDKDILKELLDENKVPYEVIAITKQDENLPQKVKKLLKSSLDLYRLLKNYNPDLMIGCISQLCWVSYFLKTKCIFNAEDDIHYTYLQGIITYPFTNTILTPSVVNVKPFSKKRIGYNGFHKLAYLHPNRFTPDINIVKKYIESDSYFIIRLVSLNAYHDVNAQGLNVEILEKIINKLKLKGEVYISSEGELPEAFSSYELKINPKDIHHLLYYSKLFIGDSQSMTVEAAMLGTPSIRINNFANKISVINELEYKYNLTYSFLPNKLEQLNQTIDKVLNYDMSHWEMKRSCLIDKKIDVTAFFVWFIESYPQSVEIMKKTPEFQYNFK